MRIDATIPDREGKRLVRLAKQLGLSRSELVSEAVSYFLRLSDESNAGRRLLLHDPTDAVPPRELVSRALSVVPVPLPSVREPAPPTRPSALADRAWRDELTRVKALTPYERVAEAFELGEDE